MKPIQSIQLYIQKLEFFLRHSVSRDQLHNSMLIFFVVVLHARIPEEELSEMESNLCPLLFSQDPVTEFCERGKDRERGSIIWQSYYFAYTTLHRLL